MTSKITLPPTLKSLDKTALLATLKWLPNTTSPDVLKSLARTTLLAMLKSLDNITFLATLRWLLRITLSATLSFPELRRSTACIFWINCPGLVVVLNVLLNQCYLYIQFQHN